jgi:hypothetical protein
MKDRYNIRTVKALDQYVNNPKLSNAIIKAGFDIGKIFDSNISDDEFNIFFNPNFQKYKKELIDDTKNEDSRINASSSNKSVNSDNNKSFKYCNENVIELSRNTSSIDDDCFVVEKKLKPKPMFLLSLKIYQFQTTRNERNEFIISLSTMFLKKIHIIEYSMIYLTVGFILPFLIFLNS